VDIWFSAVPVKIPTMSGLDSQFLYNAPCCIIGNVYMKCYTLKNTILACLIFRIWASLTFSVKAFALWDGRNQQGKTDGSFSISAWFYNRDSTRKNGTLSLLASVISVFPAVSFSLSEILATRVLKLSIYLSIEVELEFRPGIDLWNYSFVINFELPYFGWDQIESCKANLMTANRHLEKTECFYERY